MSVTATQLVGEVTIEGAEKSQAALKTVGAASDTLQKKFSSIKPFDMSRSITEVDAARAKLTLIESDVQTAREKLQTLQNSANAGEAITGIPEAEAKLVLLQEKAQTARAGLAELESQAAQAGQEMRGELGPALASVGNEAGVVGERLRGGFLSSIRESISTVGGGFLSSLRAGIGGLLDFGAKIGQTAFGIQAFVQTMGSVASALLSPNASMEQTQVAFTQLLGGAKAANKELTELQKIAADTPFEFPDLASAEQKLIAFQIPLKQTHPLLLAIGDALSGLGQNTPATLEQVVQVFGQMNAAGKIQTQDLLQLTSVGINGFQILADQMHKPVSVIKDMVTNGTIPAAQGIEMLRKGMEATFGGGMAAQAGTFNGLLSTFKDNIGAAWRAFTGPLFEQAKTALLEVGKLVSSKPFQDFAATAGKAVVDVFRDIGSAVKNVMQIFGSLDLSGLMQAFQDLGNGLKTLASSKDVTGFLDSLRQGFERVKQIVGGELGKDFQLLTQQGQQLGQWFQSTMLPAIQQAMPGFEHLGSVIATTVVPAFAQIWAVGQQLARQVLPPLISAFETIEPVVVQVGGFIANQLGNALQFLAPFAVQAAQALGQFAGDIVSRVQPAIQGIATALEAFLGWIAPYWPAIWSNIQNTIVSVWDIIKGVVQVAWSIISGIIKVGLDILSGNWGQAWEDIKATLSGVWDGIQSIFAGLMGFIGQSVSSVTSTFSGVISTVQGVLAGIGTGIANFFSGLGATVQAGLSAIGGFFANIFGAIGGWFTWLYNHNYIIQAICDFLRNAFQSAISWLQGAWSTVIGWLAAQWARLSGMASIAFGAVSVVVQAVVNSVIGWLKGVWNGAVSTLSNIWNSLKGIAQTVWNNVAGVFNGAWAMLSGPMNNVGNNVKGSFGNIATQALDWGRNIIQSIINGIQSMLGALGQAASNAASTIAGYLGFHSPAKLGPGRELLAWPRNLVRTYADQLQQNIPALQSSLTMLMQPVATTLGGNSLNGVTSFVPPSVNSNPTIVINMPPNDVYMDGHRLTQAQMPYLANAIRVATGSPF